MISAGYRALIEENVKASVRRIATNSVITNVWTPVASATYFYWPFHSTMLYWNPALETPPLAQDALAQKKPSTMFSSTVGFTTSWTERFTTLACLLALLEKLYLLLPFLLLQNPPFFLLTCTSSERLCMRSPVDFFGKETCVGIEIGRSLLLLLFFKHVL